MHLKSSMYLFLCLSLCVFAFAYLFVSITGDISYARVCVCKGGYVSSSSACTMLTSAFMLSLCHMPLPFTAILKPILTDACFNVTIP